MSIKDQISKLNGPVEKVIDAIGIPLGKAQELFAKTIFKISPLQKTNGEELPQIQFDWKTFRKTFRIKHFFIALISLSLVIFSVFKLWDISPTIMSISVLRTIYLIINYLVNLFTKDNSEQISSIIATGLILSLILFRKQVKTVIGEGPDQVAAGLPQYALREEIIFRAYSHNWNLIEKIRANLSFGLIHLTMLIVPISVALALAIGGSAFMLVYLNNYKKTKSTEMAIIEAATVHTTYNIIAFSLAIGSIIWSLIGKPILSLLTH